MPSGQALCKFGPCRSSVLRIARRCLAIQAVIPLPVTVDTDRARLQSIRVSENAAIEDEEDLAAREVGVFATRVAERLMRASNATAMSVPPCPLPSAIASR